MVIAFVHLVMSDDALLYEYPVPCCTVVYYGSILFFLFFGNYFFILLIIPSTTSNSLILLVSSADFLVIKYVAILAPNKYRENREKSEPCIFA